MYAAFRAFYKAPARMAGGTLIMQGAAALFVYWRARRDPNRGASEQLGLGRGRVGLWAWPIFFLASFVVSWAGAIVMWLGQRAGVLPTAAPLFDRDMHVLAGLSGPAAILVAFLIGPAAGIGEELVMRGFLQRRLMRRWPVWRSIFVTSLLFAAFHLDISHIIGVVPVGVWFGYIAWRADSTRPTIAVHGAIDVMYFLMALVPDIGQPLRDYTIPLSVLGVICLPVSIVILERAGREHARRPGAPEESDAD
jgi:membrane protease YdiL (CAAX protease family)